MAYILTFLLGYVNGLRSLTPPALVCWAVRLGWLHFAGTRLAFIGNRSTLIIFTLLAALELVADKMPNTPARTQPLGLTARIFFGGMCGLALAVSAGRSAVVQPVIGSIGAVVGAFAGYHSRHWLVSKAHLADFAVAIAEDVIAIGGGLFVLSLFAR